MDRKTKKLIITLVIYSLALTASWLMTCGIYKLVTLCFGWEFRWSIATGIWLIYMVIKDMIKASRNKD